MTFGILVAYLKCNPSFTQRQLGYDTDCRQDNLWWKMNGLMGESYKLIHINSDRFPLIPVKTRQSPTFGNGNPAGSCSQLKLPQFYQMQWFTRWPQTKSRVHEMRKSIWK